MITILVVDDDKEIQKEIKDHADLEGYHTIQVTNGIDAIKTCKDKKVDIIVMDAVLPGMDGFSTCKEICKMKNIPVIITSTNGDKIYKLLAFELGINDYLVKPFFIEELFAKIKVILRREYNIQNVGYVNYLDNNKFKYKGIEVYMSSRTVYVDKVKVSLTPKEYDLLLYFIRNKNIALSREQILTDVWGFDFYGNNRTVDTHIKRLRNNLGEYKNLIVTIQRVGYKLEVE
ncbi:response regulator transcription factor [Sedimentibacter hydroxybenzoicus DSM 7310]|uniref:Response regulator transcription factor n=1 Tax=Sedimentibacter hydroxybenzoicus DSM 7310 TaxID=1123245 RepID=A0A974GV47_SEDHY|nr:response regulator transcription factor [Sedimentibacter hydroxybenzoicus]NYB72715.1 response regulator transcription factor [Sedimentibacter hydroxybenzoicus DSM 7310]